MASAPLLEGSLPGVSFEAVRPPPEAPLRTDIALFIGSAQRGPVLEPVRIEGWRAFAAAFGALQPGLQMPHAIKAYFENGGRIAHVIRLAPKAAAAEAWWELASDGGFVPAAAGHTRYRVTATSPGSWGNALEVRPSYRRTDVPAGVFDFDIRLDGEVVERLRAVPAARIEAEVAARSGLVRMAPDTASPPVAPSASEGPRVRSWASVRLQSGSAVSVPGQGDYVAGLEAAMQVREAALIGLPDLHSHCNETDAAGVILAGARMADPLLDRMLVADLPEGVADTIMAQQWLAQLANDPAVARSVAFYHPWLRMRDPVGSRRAPMRTIAPSGHVLGLISRLDRIKGAHVTPANESLSDAVDLSRRPGDAVQGALNSMGINAVRCQSGRGLVVWGGQLPRVTPGGPGFVAHRRLVHRLVRALRRVAEPLVFDPADRMLALALTRAATTLLMEAFHAGVLKGLTPQEAFNVSVSPDLNDAAAKDAGRLICEISIAPAVPMEFIHIRVGLNPAGEIEMVEA